MNEIETISDLLKFNYKMAKGQDIYLKIESWRLGNELGEFSFRAKRHLQRHTR